MGSDTGPGRAGAPPGPPRWTPPAVPSTPVPPPAQEAADADGQGALVRGGIGLGLVGIGWATRLLGGWDEARWWLLEAALLVAGGALGLTGIVGAVGALGRVARSRLPMAGTTVAAVALALSGLALTGAGVVGGVDWTELDVPAAWDRLGPGDEPSRFDIIEQAANSAPDPRPGACLTGDGAAGLGTQVDCADAHRIEVLAVVDHPQGTDRPDRAELDGVLRDDCADGARARALPPGLAPQVAVRAAPELEWAAGDRWTLCVVAWDEPVVGQQAP